MKNKFFIIFLCVVILFMSVYGFTYLEAYAQIEKGVSFISSTFDTVGGLFGILSDRTERLDYLTPGAFGFLSLPNQNIDIARYISSHYLPSWLTDINNQYSVNVYVSPNFYNVTFYGDNSRLLMPGFESVFTVLLHSERAIRLKIEISSINYRSSHHIFVLVGDYNDGDVSQRNLFYSSFDIGLNTYKFSDSYSSFEDFIADSNDVTGIIDSNDLYKFNYPYDVVRFQETDVKLKDDFQIFYNFTEGIN